MAIHRGNRMPRTDGCLVAVDEPATSTPTPSAGAPDERGWPFDSVPVVMNGRSLIGGTVAPTRQPAGTVPPIAFVFVRMPARCLSPSCWYAPCRVIAADSARTLFPAGWGDGRRTASPHPAHPLTQLEKL
jgi:hypothetical protein